MGDTRRVIVAVVLIVGFLVAPAAFGFGDTSSCSCESAAEIARLQSKVELLEKQLAAQMCTSGASTGSAAKQADANVDGAESSFLGEVRIISSVPNAKSFKQIGDALRDDKTHRHRYDVPYTMYLEAHREQALDVLEIGLGCDQERIGASVLLWEQYLPAAKLTMIEFDERCGRKWQKENAGRGPRGGVKFYFGDQADKAFLQSVVSAENKKFDLIIDDGGHKMTQQIASFEALWPAVRRGGVYVIEDINTNYKTRYGGSRRPNCTQATSMNMVKDLLDRVHALPVKGHPGKFQEDNEFKSPIARVDCHHYICFITKR